MSNTNSTAITGTMIAHEGGTPRRFVIATRGAARNRFALLFQRATTLALVAALLSWSLPALVRASTGDAAFIGGTDTILPSTDGTTAEVSVAGIQNTTTNVTSGSLGFALWYSPVPYSGGTITGYRVADSYLPIGQCTSLTLAPGGECVAILVEDTLTLPPAGVYYPVLVLVEHTATCADPSGYCIDDFVNLVRSSDGGATVTVGSGGGGGGGGATSTSSVAIVGNYSYTPDLAAGTVQLDVAEIQNNSSTNTTGTLRLELWLTTTPFTGGSINGYRVATYQVSGSSNGELGPNQYFSSIAATVPLSGLPGSGTYDVALLVTEYSNSCGASDHFCLDTYGMFPSSFTIGGGGNTGGNGNISIVGSYAYSANASLSSAQLQVAEILNSSATYKTGTLRLELWLTTTPYAGGLITGNRIASYQITGSSNGTLGPNQDFSNINVSVPLGDLPGPGTYDATLIVSEYTNSCGTTDGYCIDTYGTFANQFVVASTNVVSNTGGHSGGGAIGGAEVLGLLGLLMIQWRRSARRPAPAP